MKLTKEVKNLIKTNKKIKKENLKQIKKKKKVKN